ncbi:MAG: cation:proton antiporter [Tepidisphaeraceae bacterium]
MTLAAIYLALLFLYSLISARLEKTVITAPILFTASGIGVHFLRPEMQAGEGGLEAFLRIAEIGLVLLLFTDASRTDLRILNSIRNLPARLLSTGMLLTLGLGAVCAMLVFGGLSVWEAGILAAILAPTDAGLGQVIVNSPRVPMRIRQALNVEAGLNDGLSVPFLLFFIALAVSGAAGRSSTLARFVVEQLGFGAAIGIGIGLVGGWLIGLSRRKQWISESLEPLGVFTLPLLCAVASEASGASMFIAAFVAGLSVQVGFRDAPHRSGEFAEGWGQLLNLFVFFLFGLLVAIQWKQFGPAHLLYAILSLTIVRMLPVAIALIGTRLSAATVLFMGWFGPRGLASIVLGLVYLEHETHHTGEHTIRLAVMATVFLSIFAHGVTALPGMAWYAARTAALGPAAPESRGLDGMEEGNTAAA